ncbi:4-hydroxybenzoyl-CoA thioesterase [Rathayibacter sp. AY1G1]|jgi:acyl-CoA thioester hydrolase|uniref:acyl-CoA thioesterase n=1 Tax=unclassified Rathayibacter TaxID=2609250 RepID=UPI000CE78F1F|nr:MULTISPECIES: thioesterase family protein [unclassified Rathayibacter]PPF11080.1 4-hydroxybenzoyl-CoA thioesterase [Rathayibacter sp. AY1A5]PPF14932.1 4-hydroxybenzoyl-CoA thioesterase [Rathayibacter sp. AY1A4]PPF20629.1 4-hydroxybenzoyl-CoA thioesterase [Rathayibacter sp. AY1A7]PPF37845.1 4-hydroxybenzoyl-CoA thioesterase [Rathayibacter sp. AY1A2]PPF48004.1 4-hydroxybenzoyl-CoA thioesterase [Rathayibacter sp. AY1A1]
MRLHVAIPLRWSDFDAYAHVNNAEMLRLLEEARIQAFWKPDSPQPGGMATAVLDARPGAESISLIARQEIEYLAPIPYMRAPIDVELWIGRIGGASLEVCYELYSPAGVVPRVLFTKAATTLVLVTAATGRPQRIPEELREAWGPYVEEPITFSKRG